MLFVVLGYLKVVDQKTLVSYVCLTFFLTLIFAKKCEQILIINNLKLKNNKKNNQQKLKFFYKVQYEIFSKINLLINSGFVYAVIISGYLKDKKIGHLFYTVLQSCISNGPESTLSLNEIPIKLENISTDLDNKTFLLSLFWLIVFITQSIYWFLHYFVKKKNCRMINIKDSVHLDSAMIDLM
ncbi:putative integral membrane protein [Candidatus Phytoplasma phoenicium]|uniref:Putative integral membrane protein n=2 Tax=Candidatus Phytoplasma phoenicium TaxID=198422 RepID=A0A0L0MK12_9MOLU|nr:putative integral membrane protein [Candidatus Phytoplasma phoenicium]